jgi:hypothetical protein
MKINFTKKQYMALAKVVYLGDWLANAQRVGGPDDPQKDEYDVIANYVYSFASEFDFEEYIEHEASDGEKYFPTRKFEEDTDVQSLIEEYDEENFWYELPNKLGERDFINKYSEEDIDKMSNDERFFKLQECIYVWEQEIDNNGINRLGIIKCL